jgi:hypothetical protein
MGSCISSNEVLIKSDIVNLVASLRTQVASDVNVIVAANLAKLTTVIAPTVPTPVK